MPQNWWESAPLAAKPQTTGPYTMPVAPRLPSPQTPDEAALTAAQVAASRASTQHTQLENRKLMQDMGTGDGSTIPVRGNPNLTGEDYLKTLPATDAAIIRAMAEGRQGLPAGYSMRSRQAMQLLAEAHQFDPTLDAANLPSRIATRKQYTSGAQSKNIVSLNTALGHLDSLARSVESLHNFDGVPVVNRMLNAGRNAYLSNTGGPSAQPLSQFGIDQQAVVNEMERVFSGTGGTVSALKEWEGKINASKSPSELRAAIAEGARLLQSRLEALHQGYNGGMGTTDQELPFLNPHARATIDALQSHEYQTEGYQGALRRVHGQPPAAGGAAPPPGGAPPPPAGPSGGAGRPVDPTDSGYIGFQGAPDPYQGKIVAIDRQKHQAWAQDMLRIPRGQMSDEQLAAAMDQRWRQIDGRPLVNAIDVARYYNKTGKISGGDPIYQPVGDLKHQVDHDRADQALINRQDISSARGRGGVVEGADANIRSAANSFTWGGADKLSAFLSPGDYRNNLARERAIGQYDSQHHPLAQLTGSALGLVGNEVGMVRGLARAGKTVPMLRRVGEMIPEGVRPAINDAAYGSISGAVNSDGSPADRGWAALRMGVAGAAGGVAGRAVGRGAGRILTGARDEAVQALSRAGVPMTVGQIAGRGGIPGRIIKAGEDALMSLPIIGSAIKARRQAGIEAFNRETFNQALKPIAETTNGQIGEQGVQSARDAVGRGYSKALDGVNIHFGDPVFARDLGRAIGQGQRLHPEVAKDFEAMIQNELAPVIAKGTMSGEEYQALQQAFAKERAAWKGQPRGNQYGSALRHVQGVLESLVRRQAPDAVPALERANLANRLSKTAENAVERGANTGGTFTPAQLGMAARQSGRRFGNSAATPGRPFFDLQRAGQDVLPSQIPNSGTFDRAALGAMVPAALGAGGYELGMDPEQIAVMSALGLPFTKTGQAAFQKLLVSRPDVVRNIGKQVLGAGVNRGLFGAPATAAALSYAGN